MAPKFFEIDELFLFIDVFRFLNEYMARCLDTLD